MESLPKAGAYDTRPGCETRPTPMNPGPHGTRRRAAFEAASPPAWPKAGL